MSFFEVENHFHIDFSYLAIIISAINGGFLSSFITGLVIICFSTIFGGISPLSLIVSTLILFLSVGCGVISKFHIKKSSKWIYMIGYILAIQFFFMFLSPLPVEEKEKLYTVLSIYSILTILFSFIIYYLSEYINQSNLLLIKYKEESYTDYLTGLNNVRKFKSSLNELSRRSIKRKESLSLIMIDIDWFKSINDTYGHPSGDAVLIEVGKILKKICRTSDVISRIGGEEFSVLSINCTDKQSMEIAELIRKTIEKHEFVLPTGKKTYVSISVGVATFPDTVSNVGQLVESADIALYEAKRTGRNKIALYS